MLFSPSRTTTRTSNCIRRLSACDLQLAEAAVEVRVRALVGERVARAYLLVNPREALGDVVRAADELPARVAGQAEEYVVFAVQPLEAREVELVLAAHGARAR